MDVSEKSLPEISERIVYLERTSRMRLAEWLVYVGEFDHRGAAHLRGFSSTAEWLAFECGMDRRTARDHVRVARRLRELPAVAEAFAFAQLSYSKVRALSRAETVEDERELLRVALSSTASQLEQHVRKLRTAASADLDLANRGRARRFVRHFWDEDGTLRFFGRLPTDDGAAFIEALEGNAATIRGHTCCTGEHHRRPPIDARRADALIELMTGGGYDTQIVLHTDPAALACTASGDEPRAGSVLYLRDGPAIPSVIARRLTCDAKITIDGLNLGRSTRVATPAQRRALEALDGRICSMPGCDHIHGLAVHHLDHWVHGGATDLVNLTLLCPYHHRLFHDDRWSAKRGQGRELIIARPDGRRLLPLPIQTGPVPVAA